MARRKSIENAESELSAKEVYDVLEFSRNLVGGLYPGILTPDLLSQRAKEISFSPADMTEDEMTAALKDPKNHEAQLRSIVEYIEICSAPFRRILSYMASQLALDLTYTATNIEDDGEYKKPQYKKDQKIVGDWLDRFDYQYHFRNVIRQLLRNEVYVGCIRNESSRISLQELPLQYVRLVSRWDFGYLCAFDFSYFLQPGTSLDLFPNFFKEKFFDLFGRGDKVTQYNPALPPELRGNSQFVYWVDLPPQVAFVFKLDPSIATAVPYYSSLVPEFQAQPIIRALQKNIMLAESSKMLIGAVPMIKDSKVKVADMIAINPETLGKFLALVRSGMSEAIKIAAAPLENLTALSFDGDNEVYESWLHNSISSSGVNTPLIFSGRQKANMAESQLSFESDSLQMEQMLYPQFNAFLNYYVNKETKKYKFAFEFEGNPYYLNRQQRLDKQLQLMAQGICLPAKIAASLGMKPQTMYRMMAESKAMGFTTEMLTPIVPAFQQSGGGVEGERPQKKDSEMTDSAAQTREDGGNEEKTAGKSKS